MKTAEELFFDFLQGDQHAFEELVYRFREPLTAFLYRILLNRETAQDVAQDVFVEVLEKKGFRPKGAFRSWLFAIARHKAIDYIRKNRRTMLFDDVEHLDHTVGPEEQILAVERRERAGAALRQLKDDRRMALLLTAAEGLSYEEAAEVLHKTPDQIRNLCYRGRQQLRQMMKEVDGGDE